MDVKVPPVILVKTWISLINSMEDEAVRKHATTMLMNSFDGNMQKIAEFCSQNNISMH